MLTVLGIVALVVTGILLLLIGALLAPVRVGITLQGARRLSGVKGDARLYGGLVGVGVHIDRGTYEAPHPRTIAVGLMFWRWFLPVRNVADASGMENCAMDSSSPWEAPSVPDPPDETISSDPPSVHMTGGNPSVHDIPFEENTPRPVKVTRASYDDDPLVIPAESSWRTRLRTVRRRWDEWYPVARGVLRRLRGVIRLRRFVVEGTVGLDDPALTGQMVGWAAAMRALEGRALRVRVGGAFDGTEVQGTLRAEWRISMLRLWHAGAYLGWVLARRWWKQRRTSKHT